MYAYPTRTDCTDSCNQVSQMYYMSTHKLLLRVWFTVGVLGKYYGRVGLGQVGCWSSSYHNLDDYPYSGFLHKDLYS